jgi:hypothetical protein
MIRANHKDTKWRGEIIKKGEFLTSYDKLSSGTGLTIQNVRTSIKNLESTGELTRQSTSKLTKLTICNYATYNDSELSSNKPTNKPVTNEQQTSNKQVTTDKNEKNLKNKKDLSFNYTKGLFEAEIPEEWFQVWIQAYPAVDVISETKKAQAWLFSNPSKRKKDHKRFLTGWMSRTQEKGGTRNFSSQQELSYADKVKNHNPRG